MEPGGQTPHGSPLSVLTAEPKATLGAEAGKNKAGGNYPEAPKDPWELLPLG